MAEASTTSGRALQIDVPSTLDTKYRDVFNLHITPEDLVLEFGTLHRHETGRGIILERLALSPSNAIRLHQCLGEAISQIQQKIRDQNKPAPDGPISTAKTKK